MYAWKVNLDGADISDKVFGFSITCSLESFCREMTIDISDPDLYAGLDFSQISESPEIEIYTKTGENWISQGQFFIERPALATTIQSGLMEGVWGRSLTAMLAEPFATKVTKAWEEKTTFFNICKEMCDQAGFAWDEAYSDIDDFVIYPYTYEAEGVYPIDVISELAELAGALVTTDRLGHLCIKRIDYAPSSADVTITDDNISGINESPEWPTFANRVRITPTGALAGYSIEIFIPDPCLQADGASRSKLYAQVRDPDGGPVDGLVVNWEIDSDTAALNSEISSTQEILILSESQRATGFYSVNVDIPPSAVDGIYAYSDTARQNNFAAAGYTIEGNTITLTDKLEYCDQSLVIFYRARGMAINYLIAGDQAENVTVSADVEGQQESDVLYIGNPCECPPFIRLTAAPTSIYPGSKTSLIVYGEESGPITTGRMIFMAEVSATKRGALAWTRARLGTVSVKNEDSAAINEVSGITQCEISMFPTSVSSVYAADDNGNPTGSNLYSSHNGKVIDLNAILATGTDLLVNYTARGAALNHFTGAELGTATINAWMITNREEGAEASASVRIVDNTEITDDYPDDWSEGEGDGGYGGSGGSDDDDYDDGFDPGESGEPGAGFNWCVSENVSDNPRQEALQARFATALEHDCECAEVCDTELEIHDTIQSYDGASGRPISQIVIEDYGLTDGSPEYWEKYEELKAEALAECVAQCTQCEGLEDLAWSEDNPETIAPESSVSVSVSGDKAPYTWSVSGTGFWFDAGYTLTTIQGSASVTLYADETACGAATITATGGCGGFVTGHVLCTVGLWSDWTYTCGSWSIGTYSNTCCNLVQGKTWYQAWCRYGVGCVCGGASQECFPIDYGNYNCSLLAGAFMMCCHWPEGDPKRGTFCERYATWECG